MQESRTDGRRRWMLRALALVTPIALAAAFLLSGSAHQLPALGPLGSTALATYYIADGMPGSEFRESDRDLALWALGDWEQATRGGLRFEESDEENALVRIYWVPARAGQYGEARPITVNGRRGAEVFIRPDVTALGPDIARLATLDSLLRDTIVYLTCLHEIGHALGLAHTADFADIMYFFGFGGDIPGFFGRYRDRLERRRDIEIVSGLSANDVARVRALYPSR
jgi:hypothetical protein